MNLRHDQTDGILRRIDRGLFSRNDFFPFTRDELKQHDPGMEQLLAKLWGVTK